VGQLEAELEAARRYAAQEHRQLSDQAGAMVAELQAAKAAATRVNAACV
jgi:hypothetical protein